MSDSTGVEQSQDAALSASEPVSDEVYEIEVDEDLIAYYIEDEDGNELGFAILEDGVEVEYYYAEDEADEAVENTEASDDNAAEKAPASSQAHQGDSATRTRIKPLKQAVNEFDPGVTKEDVATATSDLNAIYKDGVVVARELKGAIDDISSTFDFLKKKK